ncbi:MAG: 1-acyl-sn-glycerol-3-phosphate acyltransferase [Bacteriovoracia bacterium]
MNKLKQAKKSVLSYKKLVELIGDSKEDAQAVSKMVEEIHGEFSPSVIKASKTFLDNTLAHLYESLNLEIPKGMNLKQLVKDYHVVLVPNHQSHADYIAITYLLYKKYKLPILIAGGINLNVLGLGSFFRRTGAFFIRRSFQGNQLYKYTLEAYIHYLLEQDLLLEFFFEGGRSRTGKLLAPRYGLFNLLLDAHQETKDNKPLMFIPVSIAHEYLPESKSHVRELAGAKKKKEKTRQILKIYKLFNKKLGSIHLRLGEGIVINKPYADIKKSVQDLAFKCFKSVGKGIPVTPTSLLAMVLLDEPEGALTLGNIKAKANDVIEYCIQFDVPLTLSLQENNWEQSIEMALKATIKNKKVKKFEKKNLGQTFYYIRRRSRSELLYFKNMILHHFLVPCFIQVTFPAVYNGEIKDNHQLTSFLLSKRNELKYEFYLPSGKELLSLALKVISYYVGREVHFLKESLELTSEELLTIAHKLKSFSSALIHIYEGYYIAGKALKHFVAQEFTEDEFFKVAKEVFELERIYGRVVKYPESYSQPLMLNALQFFLNADVLFVKDGVYSIEHSLVLDKLIAKFAKDLNDQLVVNFRTGQIEKDEIINVGDK